MKQELIFSNCFFQAVKVFILYFPKGRIGFDFNSPSGFVSFYCDVEQNRFRFRRKIRRYSNKSKFLFYGYTVIEKL